MNSIVKLGLEVIFAERGTCGCGSRKQYIGPTQENPDGDNNAFNQTQPSRLKENLNFA